MQKFHIVDNNCPQQAQLDALSRISAQNTLTIRRRRRTFWAGCDGV